MQYIFEPQAWKLFFNFFPGLWPFCAAFTGAILASFFGVVVDRLPKKVGWNPEKHDPDINLITPSRCDNCGVRLNFIALIPILGWLFYKGKCFNCKSSVPSTYPCIEAITAFLSAIVAVRFGVGEQAIWALAALWGSVLLSWMDWREQWLLDRATIPLLMAGLLASPFQPDVLLRNEGMFLFSSVLFLIFAWKGWSHGIDMMSGGDLVMAAVAGAWLGLPYVPALLGFTGLIFAVYTLPLKLKGEKWAPMGPALCGAWIVCLMLGEVVALKVN